MLLRKVSVLACSHLRVISPKWSLLNQRPSHSLPPLTAGAYNVKRGDFAQITDNDLTHFQSIIGKDHVITDHNDLEMYNMDWMRSVRGQSKLLLKPKTTNEVSQIVKHCNERKLAVCPQGGNTGLVGGSVPVFDEIVLSTQRMNNIILIDPVSGVLVCQAGCILEAANNQLSKHSLMAPLDLGAKGSCHLGGNISTNAGGLRLLRYGSLRGSVLGVEAVLPSGEILDCLSELRKDNTGYDLKQLLIGSEGTLGIVTALAIQCVQKPLSTNLAFLGVESFSNVLSLLRGARRDLGEILSAVEFMDQDCMRLVTTHLDCSNPISSHPFYMLIETSGSNTGHDEEKLSAFLDKIMSSGLAVDGTLATDVGKLQSIWALRERIAEATLREGYNYKYDVSLPTEHMYTMVEESRKRLQDVCLSVFGYGHVGDGNLHLNMTSEKFDPKVLSMIEPFVYEWVSKYKGSVSAEHGMGFKKRQYMGFTKSKSAITLMHRIKELLDPNGIFNPYKTLPDP
uniref:D-2-hydroxyglutarate dehydrogenase, mitochondrial n=1 Tax=Phallusia mammillata TaxID=59560 RepID=A0A6F9DB91_9ASCI|nr:D-2-hydroxyglutarate dehydrogenase, mitochondrial-like [Phallusia mammillata]